MSHTPPTPEKKSFRFFFRGKGDWLEKSEVFHLKFWYMAFSHLGSHNVLGPSWHWVALTISFVLPNHFCFFKNFLILLQPVFSFDPWFFLFVRCTGLPFLAFCLVTNHSYLVAMYLEKGPHDLSGSTRCLRIPCFLCLHPTDYSPPPIYCSKSLLSWWDCVYLPVNPAYPEWSVIVCLWYPSFSSLL